MDNVVAIVPWRLYAQLFLWGRDISKNNKNFSSAVGHWGGYVLWLARVARFRAVALAPGEGMINLPRG